MEERAPVTGRPEKTVEESRVETIRLVRPEDINSAGRLFGGSLMQWMDEVAAMVAKRHVRGNVTTLSVDNLRFLKGAYQEDMIVLIGRLTFVGKTSMEVRVDAYVEGTDGMRRPITRAYFTLVALDGTDRPAPVPGLIRCTSEQRIEWEAGERRRAMRVLRREEGF